MPRDAGMRTKMLTVRMNAEETQRLQAVADHYALNVAGVLRMLVKREFDALPPAEQKRPKKQTRKR